MHHWHVTGKDSQRGELILQGCRMLVTAAAGLERFDARAAGDRGPGVLQETEEARPPAVSGRLWQRALDIISCPEVVAAGLLSADRQQTDINQL